METSTVNRARRQEFGSKRDPARTVGMTPQNSSWDLLLLRTLRHRQNRRHWSLLRRQSRYSILSRYCWRAAASECLLCVRRHGVHRASKEGRVERHIWRRADVPVGRALHNSLECLAPAVFDAQRHSAQRFGTLLRALRKRTAPPTETLRGLLTVARSPSVLLFGQSDVC